MTLLAPLALLGLLGLALPLLAHLRGRAAPRVVPFAALRFLRGADPRVRPRHRPQDRALLALRLALLALAVLALARPVARHPADLAVLAAPHDALLLLDASASMGLEVDGEPRLVAAGRAAEGVLAALPPGSRAALLSSDPAHPRIELSADHARIRAVLADLAAAPPRPGAWPLQDALPLAAALLGPNAGRPRVLYAIGDRGPGGLPDLPPLAPGDLPILLVPVDGPPTATPPPPEHLGLDDAAAEPALELDPRAFRVRAVVRSHGRPDPQRLHSVPVRLLDRGEVVARAVVQVPAGDAAPVEFTHTLTGGGPAAITLELELDGDPFPADDRRHLWLAADPDLAVTVVNGDPSEIRTRDEVFFLATALAAAAEGPPVRLRTLAPDQLDAGLRADPAALLGGVDVLILANVPAPAEDVAAALQARVAAGMGLWITVGDRVDAPRYNRRLGDLLPLLLREPVLAGSLPGRAEARGEGLAPPDLGHPALRGLRGDLGLLGARARRLYLLEPDPARAPEVALTYESGAPLLLTRPYQRGRVALLTTSLDRDWSDLPLRPGFVPLALRLLDHLASRGDPAARDLLAGQPLVVPAAGPAVALTPSGRRLPLVPGDDGRARLADTLELGHYQLLRGDDAPPLPFVVNLDPREADTAPRPLPPPPAAAAHRLADAHRPLWRPLAALALLLLAAESLLRLRLRPRPR